ncbi:MAG: hypothetical protein E2O68_03525, partial [Deltaproteobacteria bacterium]
MKTLLIIPFLFMSSSNAKCVKDVVNQWKNLKHHGKRIYIKNNDRIFRKNSYTMRIRNKLGIDNHFQGVQRIPGEKNFVVSGGDIRAKRADLFVIIDGKFQRRINLDMWPYWHPGGIQVYDNILAVGVEEWKESKVGKIYFYDFKDPENPIPLKTWIDIPHTKTGAVFFHKLFDGRYVVGSHDQTNIEIYFSKTTNINDGFPEKADMVLNIRESAKGIKTGFLSGAQTINLIEQCDGKLFLTTFNNRGKMTPIRNDKDLGQLFSIDISINPPIL